MPAEPDRPPSDEPLRHPGYLALLALAAFGTAPIPFLFLESGPSVLGIPAWLVWSLGFTMLLSCLTAWGILRYWKDGPLE